MTTTRRTAKAETSLRTPNPAEWEPQSWRDLIGPAQLVAAVLEQRLATHPEVSLRILLTGPQGTGKSALSLLLARRLAGHVSDIERVSGKLVNVERVQGWLACLGTSSIFGGHCVKVIEEIDQCTRDGMTLLLQYLDLIKTRTHYAVLASTNMDLNEVFTDRRLASRFQQFPVKAPGFMDIAGFLTGTFGIEQEEAEEIAIGASGDVRAACMDAQSRLDVAAAGCLLATLAA